MAKGLSRRAYADRRGVSETAVRKAIKEGRITVGGNGLIDPGVADAQWEKNTDPSKPLNSVTGNPRHRKESPDAPSTPVNGKGGKNDEAVAGYTKARAVRELYASRLTKIEWEEKTGSLISRELVEAAAFAAGKEIANKLLTMPRRVSATLAALTTARECERTLLAEVRELLKDLEHALAAAARPKK